MKLKTFEVSLEKDYITIHNFDDIPSLPSFPSSLKLVGKEFKVRFGKE